MEQQNFPEASNAIRRDEGDCAQHSLGQKRDRTTSLKENAEPKSGC